MNRLWIRLTLTFLLLVWLMIGAMALVVQRVTETGFRQYLVQREASNVSEDLISRLQGYYVANGSWDGVVLTTGGRGEGGNRGAITRLANVTGAVVASSSNAGGTGGELSDEELALSAAIIVNGEKVGYLSRQTPGSAAFGTAETLFLNEASQTLFVLAAVLSVLAVGIGVGLAWRLMRPLSLLTETVRSLKSDKLGQQVKVQGTQEITALADAFNAVSTELAQGEMTRQRMAADIAHELRTPVTVLRGHLEAMRDGIFPLNQEHLAVVYDQTLHLGRLVDDLRMLTLAQSRHLSLNLVSISSHELVNELIESFRPLALDAGVRLELDEASGPVTVKADAIRIRQVIGNLLTNALRHTPADGEIAIRIEANRDHARFSVCNSGSTLDEKDIDRVFLPFWRASESRERDSGGSGLGLAISKQLVELHNGKMWVESSPTRVCFKVELPLA